MAQTFTSTEVTSGTNVFGDNQSQRVNENTLRSNFSGSSQPSDPVVGQHWYDTGNNREMTYNGTSWVAVDTNTATQVDVKNSAGNLSNLKSFLSVAHNDDGTLKVTPTSSIDEFKENSIVVTYVNPTTFTTPNDLTGIFTQYRKVKVYLSASTAISSVSSSSYNGTSNVTTVVLSTSAMDATLVSIRYSIVQYGTPDKYLEKSGGTITGDINWTGERYICNSNLNSGFYSSETSTGIYDRKNNRTVLWYEQSTNNIGIGNHSTVTSFAGTVSAPTFSGHLVGTADNATNATLAGTAENANGINIIAGNEIKLRGSNNYNGLILFGYDAPAKVNEYKFGDGTRTGGFASITAASFKGNLHGTADNASTLNGYTAAQLIGEVSHATNGYHKFPGGTIVQWGSATLTEQNNVISFPTAFPTACSVVHTSMLYDSEWAINYATSITTTNFNFYKHQPGAYTGSWLAIGY